ncbi:MAG: ABC transporter permease [Sneathiella sp.]|nr:ABC transporter permease [Sneathiella sp.]
MQRSDQNSVAGSRIKQFIKSLNAAWFTQERIVFAIAFILFAAFSVSLNGFFSVDNLINLMRNVSVLGILGIGMAIVVIGRGIDLSMIAVMAVSSAWTLQLMQNGHSLGLALLGGLVCALSIGVINGLLIAFVEIPALFATLATGIFLYGVGKSTLLDLDVIYLPENLGWFEEIGKGRIGPVPMAIILCGVAMLAAYLFLSKTRFGRFIYGTGDNPLAARITGIPVRVIITAQYTLASFIGFFAGIIVSTAVSAMNTRIFHSTMIYDVILVVVLGGIGLSGGKGSIRNVIVGTLLIGTLLNGMTIMDMQYTMQNLIKSLILLGAIILDSFLHPRNEETAQQGDI